MGCFFKQRKLKHLAKKEAKQEEKLQLLLQKLEKIKSSNHKLKEQIENLTQNIGKKEEKHE
jgi:hypothetical protein